MKTLFTLLGLMFTSIVHAQENFPDIYTISSQFERIEIIRMRSGMDMLEGLNQAVKEKNIKNAIILAGIGSVTDYHFHVVSDKNLPPAQEFSKASRALDLLSVQGYILNGRVHAHINVSDENNAFGGHLEPGTRALTFLILTLGVLPDDLSLENLDKYRR